MSPEEPEALSSLAKELLDLEKQRPGPSPLDEQRVLERLVTAKAFAGAAAAAGGAAAKATALKLFVAALVGAAAGGGMVGLKLSSDLDATRAELERVRAEKVVASPPPQPETAPGVPPPDVKAPEVAPPVVAAPPKPSPRTPPPKSGSMSEEAALIDQARTALLKNDLEAAAAALARHQSAFPRGRMVEEREVISIQVALGQGHDAEARSAADRFRREHPGSLLLPTVDALMEK